MTTDRCPFEEELLDALGRGYVATGLAEHVAACTACRELHLVAGALLDDRALSMLEAPIPSAGTMWWRIRARQRHDAEAAARRSLVIGQAITVAIALALIIAFFGGQLAGQARSVLAAVRLSTPTLLALVLSILATPIAGWLALRRE
jgi:hypothetical protein